MTPKNNVDDAQMPEELEIIKASSLNEIVEATRKATGLLVRSVNPGGDIGVFVGRKHRWLTPPETISVAKAIKEPLTRDEMIELDTLVHQHIIYLLREREELRRQKDYDSTKIFTEYLNRHQMLLCKLKSMTGMMTE